MTDKKEFIFHDIDKTMVELRRRFVDNEPFYYVRFGDGDLFLIDGNNKEKCHKNSPELQKELITSLTIDDPKYMAGCAAGGKVFGYQKKLKEIVDRFYDGKEFWSAVALHSTYVQDMQRFVNFVKDCFKDKKVLFIGGESVCSSNLVKEVFNISDVISLPDTNAYYALDDKMEEIERMIPDYDIVLSGIGLATRVLAGRLWHKGVKDIFYFDVGSVLDSLADKHTRGWIRKNPNKVKECYNIFNPVFPIDDVEFMDRFYSKLYKNGHKESNVKRLYRWSNQNGANLYGKSVIDCGCGNATLRDHCFPSKYVGVDISTYKTKELNKTKREHDSFSRVDVSNLSGLDGFDVSWSCDVLSHLIEEKVGGALSEMARVSRKMVIFVNCVDNKVDPIDEGEEPLYLTIRTDDWWLGEISKHAVVHAKEVVGDGLLVVAIPNHVESRFGDSVAIVGNSGSEIGCKKGEGVDAHDDVFRFNNYSTDKEYAEDYGIKTTSWVTSMCSDIGKRGDALFDVVYCPVPIFDVRYRYGKNDSQGLTRIYSKKLQVIPIQYFEELQQHIERPSTGLAFLWWVYRERGYLKDDDVYGFCFFSDNYAHHYFNEKTACKHKGNIEAEVYNKMIKGEI